MFFGTGNFKIIKVWHLLFEQLQELFDFSKALGVKDIFNPLQAVYGQLHKKVKYLFWLSILVNFDPPLKHVHFLYIIPVCCEHILDVLRGSYFGYVTEIIDEIEKFD